MISIQEQKNLSEYNTFGIDVNAKYFVEIQSDDELVELSKTAYWAEKKLILGGGSNVLLINDFDGIVIHIANKGIELIGESDDSVIVKVAAGENWHQFVIASLENEWYGIENLSLIPGSVGASPMQNIGAYGVEINQVFLELDAFHIEDKTFYTFTKDVCEFGYRTSIFKTSHKNQYIITSVIFELSKSENLNLSYGAIQSTLREMKIDSPTAKDVSNAVIQIRESKLPNPTETGNAGSFFKNPVVSKTVFQSILADYPNMPHYVLSEDELKIPAGWLIDQCGFKGKVVGNTGTYKHQALIIVNRGGATGKEIWSFANTVQSTVKEKFGIKLQAEVNLVT